ncbi:MAG: glycosyltransferase [Solirubrobacteraceae bacterium]
MKVSQVLSAAGAVDAVTNQALAWSQHFQRWGWGGEVFSARPPVGMRRHQIRPLEDLDPTEGILLLHYSGFGRNLERLVNGSSTTLLLSHNVTPSEWFWVHEPLEGVNCKLGRDQLYELAEGANRLAGVSDYNAQELREVTGREADVIPVLFDRARLGPASDGDRSPATSPSAVSSPTVLFVGRLAPHKRQDLVIRAFAEYREAVPEARLVLVGHPLSPAYGRHLAELAEELAPGGVQFEDGIPQADLADRYREADAFLCLSEHEGFCIPLLEAFHFGVPVVARDTAAVGEVAGDAGILVEGDDGLGTIAHLLRIVSEDAELAAELRARGERRLALYDQARTTELMRQTLESLAAEA